MTADPATAPTATPLETALRGLSPDQRKAAEWDDGPLLVLGGPGSGKTHVLACRIARLLDRSRDERFRILALTFTHRAARKMSDRLAALAPGLEGRADVHTFHSFCVQVLRQHGVHLGIKPDFAIYSLESDRQAVLADAVRRATKYFDSEDRRLPPKRLLPEIDSMKARLIPPGGAEEWLLKKDSTSPEDASRTARTYQLYEDELHSANALDFNSLIFETFRIFGHPAVARHYRTAYRYWLIDDLQDTNGAQYALLRRMAGAKFRGVFAAADSDQTIYAWNGASVLRARDFANDFGCEVVRLADNYRCPGDIADAANRLVVRNTRRDPLNAPAVAAARPSEGYAIECRVFSDHDEEAARIAAEIAALDPGDRGKAAVLARTRALLRPFRGALRRLNVPIALVGRREEFASPQMRWLVTCLRQIDRPLDRRNMAELIGSFASLAGVPQETKYVIERSMKGKKGKSKPPDPSPEAVRPAEHQAMPPLLPIAEALGTLASGSVSLSETVNRVMACFLRGDGERGVAGRDREDLENDLSAWRRIEREIRQDRGDIPLDHFLQEMALRSKEPPRLPGAVSLATVHGGKDLEFDSVYLIGLAEGLFPAWFSAVRNGSEEERRCCFVAITRARRRLILSRASAYRKVKRPPSRFFKEMGLLI